MENTAPELERLYFALAARIDLPRAQKRALISDFRRAAEVLVSRGLSPVSYTHLDVYKRQEYGPLSLEMERRADKAARRRAAGPKRKPGREHHE